MGKKLKKNRSYARPVLIGLMGAGKSRIGKRLACFLQIPLLDLDEMIVAEAGCSIPEIFEKQGEQAFRKLESEMLKRVIAEKAVIATGGGIVEAPANRKLLKEHPPVIWLKASPEYLARRIDGDSNRPLIAQGDTLKKLQVLAEKRYPLYEECADLVVEREFMKKKEAMRMILRFLAKWEG